MRLLMLFLTLFSTVAFGMDVPKDKVVGTAIIARLVERLGNREFAAREEATRALLEIGEPALEVLRKARTSTDAEVRRRATLLVRQIEQRIETARILNPTRVRLTLKEVPLPEAVETLAKQAGFAIQLQGDRAELMKTRITLDTGEVSFWEALGQLSRKGGLVEVAPPVVEKQPAARSGSIVIIGGGGPKPQPKDLLKNPTEDTGKPILLAVGKATSELADVTGAVRVKVLPTDAKLPGKPRGEGEYLFGIEPSIEARTVMKGVLGLRIAKAIDDQGQSLVNLSELPEVENKPNRNTSTIVINSVPLTPRGDGNQGVSGPLPLRFRKGEKQAKSLKEVTGTLVALAQTPHETLVRIDDILKATGKTVKIDQGGFVKVMEAVHKDGEVRLKLHVETPPTSLDDGAQPPINATVIINGEELGKKKNSLNAKSFLLFDDKEKPIPIAKAMDTGVRAGHASEIELVFQLDPKQGAPAKFIYQGNRTTIVEVGFTLKNVPLP